MRIKKIFQSIFKKTFQLLFILLYGKIIKDKNQQKINYKIEKINTNNSLYEIKNGRVYTDLVEHVAIIKDNFIIPKISYQQINNELKDPSFNKVLVSGTNRFKKKNKGKYIVTFTRVKWK